MKELELFPAGTYFVGDPCYVIDRDNKELDHVWSDFCDQDDWLGSAFKDEKTNIILGSASTEYGDGTYEGSDGHSYSVDSGTLGVASIDHLTEDKISNLQRLGSIKTFERPFNVRRSGSIVIIDNLEIETGDYDEDDEWY